MRAGDKTSFLGHKIVSRPRSVTSQIKIQLFPCRVVQNDATIACNVYCFLLVSCKRLSMNCE